MTVLLSICSYIIANRYFLIRDRNKNGMQLVGEKLHQKKGFDFFHLYYYNQFRTELE